MSIATRRMEGTWQLRNRGRSHGRWSRWLRCLRRVALLVSSTTSAPRRSRSCSPLQQALPRPVFRKPDRYIPNGSTRVQAVMCLFICSHRLGMAAFQQICRSGSAVSTARVSTKSWTVVQPTLAGGPPARRLPRLPTLLMRLRMDRDPPASADWLA